MDEQIWFYLIAALLYFLTRKKKKNASKKQPAEITVKGQPRQKKKPVSFEDLLKQITQEREEETVSESKKRQEPGKAEPDYTQEGNMRSFSDDESKKVYEESVRQAEGYDLDYQRNDHYKSTQLVRRKNRTSGTNTFAKEIKEGLRSGSEARKAIIYAEILKKKY